MPQFEEPPVIELSSDLLLATLLKEKTSFSDKGMPMREYQIAQVDVFTDRIFGGNPLAVVLEATGLSDAEMQAIAGELPHAPGTTTFVLSATDSGSDARVRIFTSACELPFSGHSTIGTAYVLAARRPRNRPRLVLEVGIGPVEIEVERVAGAPQTLWLRQSAPAFGAEFPDRRRIAQALGIAEADLVPGLPIQAVSGGLPFMYAAVRHPDIVDRAALDLPALLKAAPEAAALGIFVFAPGPDQAAYRVYSRMFSPHTAGIPEDPATGAASGPLAAYLVRYGIVQATGEVQIVSEQGTKMGRQSFIRIHLRVQDGEAREVRIGGRVVPVLEGVLRLP